VDCFHACQRLYAVADMLVGYTEQERLSLIEHVKTYLWEGDVSAVIQVLQNLLKAHPSCKAFQDALTNYQNNCARMNYAHFRKQNYFTGGGPVENACKQIVSERLKRAGALMTINFLDSPRSSRANRLSR
jgi:hypothetical protein